MSTIPLPPAPGAAEHVSLALVDSAVTLPGEHADELGSPAEATAWLIAHDLAPEQTALLPYCQSRLTGLRAELRALFAAQVDGETPPQRALDGINRALASASGAPLLRHDADRGLHRAARLARCEAQPCDRFLLRTHGRRQWCSTRCGDRVRAARAYARKQERLSTTA